MKTTLIPLTVLLLLPAAVRADTPRDFRRTQVFVHPTIQTRHFVGPLSDQSTWGIGFGITQGAQFGHWGASVTIDTDYFLTTQSPPPHNSGLQIAGLLLAGRYTYPFGMFRPYAELGYRHVGVISNALVSETGPELGFNALSSGLGFRLTEPSPLYFEVRGNWDWIWDLNETYLVGISFAVGVRSVL